MPAFIDIAARDLKSYNKGDIIGIAGRCSTPTDKIVGVEITDATINQSLHYVYGWYIDFSHTLVNQNENGWRFEIEVDPAYISASDVGKDELKAGMQDHVESNEYWEGSSVVSFTSNSMVVDIPKDGIYQTANELSNLDYLKLLKSNFSDVFKIRLFPSRYHASAAQVDQIIAAGGFIQITKEQALNKIIDKLEE